MRKLAGLFILLIATIGVVALALLGGGASAEDTPPVQLGPDVQLPPKPQHPKLDSHLNRLVEQLASGPVALSEGPALVYQDDKVAVTIRLSGNAGGIAAYAGQHGAIVANLGADYIEAYVPVTILPELEGQPGVLRVQAIIPPQPVKDNAKNF